MGGTLAVAKKSIKYSGSGTFLVNSVMPITNSSHKGQLANWGATIVFTCFIYFRGSDSCFPATYKVMRAEYDISVFRSFQFQEAVTI